MPNSQAENLDSVMRRVQKLLAIAGDDRANSAEAAAAAAMAEKIMRKYQLDHIDVMRKDFAQQENFETVDASAVMKRSAHKPYKVPLWAQWLAVAVARLHDCELKLHTTAELGACVRFYGYKADVKVAGWTFDYLMLATVRACRAYQKEERSKRESHAFRQGFVLRVLASLKQAKAAKDAEAAAQSDCRALVLVKQQAIAERFGAFEYGKPRDVNVRDGNAFSAGTKEGAKVDVARRALGAEQHSSTSLAIAA